MATITGADQPIRNDDRRDVVIHTWANLAYDVGEAEGDIGSGFEWPQGADRAIQVTGTLGSGGAVTMQGSNKVAPTAADADWAALDDTEGNVIDVDAVPTAINVGTICRWIRPQVTAGDGDTDLTVVLIARRR